MHGKLINDQHDELDEWVAASNENMEVFVAATDEKHISKTINKLIYGPHYPH
jgi:hypothetical protein